MMGSTCILPASQEPVLSYFVVFRDILTYLLYPLRIWPICQYSVYLTYSLISVHIHSYWLYPLYLLCLTYSSISVYIRLYLLIFAYIGHIAYNCSYWLYFHILWRISYTCSYCTYWSYFLVLVILARIWSYLVIYSRLYCMYLLIFSMTSRQFNIEHAFYFMESCTWIYD